MQGSPDFGCESIGMAVHSFRSLRRRAVLAVLVAALMVPGAVEAAPKHFDFGARGDRINSQPYNADSDPCYARGNRRALNEACPPRKVPSRRNGGDHQPGSNAFGLQFNSGY